MKRSNSVVECRSHKPKVGGAIPSSATKLGDVMSEIKSKAKKVPNVPNIKNIPNIPNIKNRGPVQAKSSAPMRKSGRGR